MKKIILIIIGVVVFFGGIVLISNSNTSEKFNIENTREAVDNLSVVGENDNFTLTINDNKYILQDKNNNSILSGDCRCYKATAEETELMEGSKIYYVACYFYEHNTDSGTEFFFDEPNGFYALISKEGKIKTNLSDIVEDTNTMFF